MFFSACSAAGAFSVSACSTAGSFLIGLPRRVQGILAICVLVGVIYIASASSGSGVGSLLTSSTSCPVPAYTSSKGKRVLVTGAAGFIGSHVAKYAANELGMEVIGVDDMSGGFDYNLDPSWTLVKGDLRDEKFVKKLFKQHGPFDHVYHIAAYAAEGLSHYIRRYNYNTNLVASINVLNEAVKSNVKTFVFTSSIAVYGTGRTPLSEDMTPMPEDPYAVSKFAVELDLKAAHEMFGINFVIFRPHNVYGSGQNIADRYRNVIGIFMRQIMAGEPMTIFGDGLQTRAFSHISEVAPQIALAPFNPKAKNQIYNVGADIPYTLKELAVAVKTAMDVPDHELKHLDPRNEVLHAYSDHKKLKCDFGIKPEAAVPLKEGLKEMVNWVRTVTKEKGGFTALVFSGIGEKL